MSNSSPYLIWERKGFDFRCMTLRLRSLGLSNKQSRQVLACMKRWITNEGPKGYLLRVSDQTVAWKNYTAGCVSSIPGTSLTKSGYPKQTFMLINVSLKVRFRVLKFMKSVIKYTELQPEQWQKFYLSATRASVDLDAYAEARVLTQLGLANTRPSAGDHYSFERPRSLYLDSEAGGKTFAPFDLPYSLPRDPEAVLIDSLKVVGSTPGYIGLVPGLSPDVTKMFLSPEPKTKGLIGVTQEPGGKARFYVSVHPVYQHMLWPLHKALRYRAKRDRNSFAFDQDKGRRWVKESLAVGTVWSYDLSDATNNYPYALQLDWLLSLCKEEFVTDEFGKRVLVKGTLSYNQVNELNQVVSGDFMLAEDIRSLSGMETLKFTEGQPLGLLPSAMLFHLSHIYLLRGIQCKLYGHCRGPRKFGVVLDDVVITDASIAAEYERVMTSIGVPINKKKSIVSDSLAEFLGRIITPTTVIELTRQARLDLSNVTEYARVHGRKIVEELNNSLQRKLEPVLALPESLGGAGFGFGRSLIDRLSQSTVQDWLYLSLNVTEKTVKFRDETDRVRMIRRALKTHSGVRLSGYLVDYLSTLLPRRRSRLRNMHRCHPTFGVILKTQRASCVVYGLPGEYPSVMIRETPDYAQSLQIARTHNRYRDLHKEDRRRSLTLLEKFISRIPEMAH